MWTHSRERKVYTLVTPEEPAPDLHVLIGRAWDTPFGSLNVELYAHPTNGTLFIAAPEKKAKKAKRS